MTEPQTSDPTTDLSPSTQALVEQVRTNEHLLKTPEFEYLGPPLGGGIIGTLCFTRACTSLADEEATARINLASPSGLDHDWVLLTGEKGGGPVPCADKPETHRHLMWEC